MTKIDYYKCCICKKKICYKPIRLVKQLHGLNPRYPSQYYQDVSYNFCKDCYKKFDNWINKYKGEYNNGR